MQQTGARLSRVKHAGWFTGQRFPSKKVRAACVEGKRVEEPGTRKPVHKKNPRQSQLESSHILSAGRDVHGFLPKGVGGNSLQMGAQPRNYPLPSAATTAK